MQKQWFALMYVADGHIVAVVKAGTPKSAEAAFTNGYTDTRIMDGTYGIVPLSDLRPQEIPVALQRIVSRTSRNPGDDMSAEDEAEWQKIEGAAMRVYRGDTVLFIPQPDRITGKGRNETMFWKGTGPSVRSHKRAYKIKGFNDKVWDQGWKPLVKKNPLDAQTRKAVEFFREQAGGIVGEATKGALDLARAERWAKDNNIVFGWDFDGDADRSMDGNRNVSYEICTAFRRDPDDHDDRNAEAIASYGGIGDADSKYRRVIEAQLAFEIMGFGTAAKKKLKLEERTKRNPNQTFLSEPSEIEWLKEGLLSTCRRLPPFEVAVIDGNEDWPDSITLYERDHINSLTMKLTPDGDDGVFHCNASRY